MSIIPKKNKKTVEVEEIAFNGIVFRRYPNSNSLNFRRYYSPGYTDRKNGVGYLHQEIWKFHNGDIPKGYHIHHKDGNFLNNSIENFECIPKGKHQSEHMKKRLSDPKKLERLRKHCDEIRPLTKEWHSSEDGKKWHQEHAKNSICNLTPILKKCIVCGDEFLDKNRRDNNRFCSNKCKAKWRRDSGIDNEIRICKQCGKEFSVNHYSKTFCCSRSCAAKNRWKKEN